MNEIPEGYRVNMTPEREAWLKSLKVGSKVCVIQNFPEHRSNLTVINNIGNSLWRDWTNTLREEPCFWIDIYDRFACIDGSFCLGGSLFGARRIEPLTEEEDLEYNIHLMRWYIERTTEALDSSTRFEEGDAREFFIAQIAKTNMEEIIQIMLGVK